MCSEYDFQNINPINSADIQIVSTFRTTVNQATGEPFQMVLNVSIDRFKANSSTCEIPVYVPAKDNYKAAEHMKMLDIFRAGAPWVPVKCDNFKIYRQKLQNSYHYFGFADSFKVVDYSEIGRNES